MRTKFRTAFLTAALIFIGGCGGGGGGGSVDNGGMGGTGVSMGVMIKGSVIVNGVLYEDNTAKISIDDTPKTAAALQNGMVVSVRGTIDGSGRNGTAQTVVAQSEVRGLVTAVFDLENPQRFVVLGQNVLIDDQTILNDVLRPISNALVGTLVEVHGLRDSTVNRNIRATRVEANPGILNGSPQVDEIRGVVSGGIGPNPLQFNLGSQPVLVTAGAQIVGGTYQNGSIVEVHCTIRPVCTPGGVFQASRIEVEDGSNLPGNGQRFEVEGLISGFGGHPGNFFVAGIPVTTSGSTTFRGGIADDLLDNIKVEAEGSWNGTRLVANKIEFKRSVVRLQGFVTAQNANTFTLDIAGRLVNVETDDFTDDNGDPLPSNGSATCVQVRGQRKAGGPVVVTAGEVRVNGCGNGRPVLQAPVEAEIAEVSITLLGFVVDVSAPTDMTNKWLNTANVGITKTQFFDAVVPASIGLPPVAGTLVKVIFNDPPNNAVKQVELED